MSSPAPRWRVVDPAAPAPFDATTAYQAGVRVVELPDPVDLAAATARDLAALRVVRDATGHGMHVWWRLASLGGAALAQLSHLHPPQRLPGRDPPAAWWKGFYLGRCGWRQGPGFIQVRDRRSGPLAKYTITEPELAGVIHALHAGAAVVDLAVAAPLIEAGLVLKLGDLLWLAPYRLVRWPTPAMAV